MGGGDGILINASTFGPISEDSLRRSSGQDIYCLEGNPDKHIDFRIHYRGLDQEAIWPRYCFIGES